MFFNTLKHFFHCLLASIFAVEKCATNDSYFSAVNVLFFHKLLASSLHVVFLKFIIICIGISFLYLCSLSVHKPF